MAKLNFQKKRKYDKILYFACMRVQKMSIFNNTTDGHYDYDDYGATVSYTFPENAYVDLKGVRISISGLKVSAYGGKFDGESNQFFNQTASLLPEKSFDHYNTKLFIDDSEVSGSGYPGRKDFKKYNINYLNPIEFNALQQEVNSNTSHPKAPLLIKTIEFLRKWSADNQNDTKTKLQAILSKSPHYPKHLSIIYDDRKLKHTTHIVLSYESPSNCILRIDNTLSPTYTFFPPHMTQQLENLGINLTTCKESVSKTNSRFIELFKNQADEKSAVQLELLEPVNSLMLKVAYARMVNILQEQLEIPITQVNINYSPYNQKNTDECVVFAIQNKIDFIVGNSSTFESTLETGTRLRAEHAVLAYLLQKTSQIPHADEQTCKDYNFNYPVSEWYLNYPEVCGYLDRAISNLEFSDLSQLFLATELDSELSLSPFFKKIVLHQMSLKTKSEDYIEIHSWLPEQEAEMQQQIMAPQILYRKDTHTLFYSKKVELQLTPQDKDTFALSFKVNY